MTVAGVLVALLAIAYLVMPKVHDGVWLALALVPALVAVTMHQNWMAISAVMIWAALYLIIAVWARLISARDRVLYVRDRARFRR